MKPETYKINFVYPLDQIRGTATIEVQNQDDELRYLARNILLFNTDEELEEAGLVREEELVIKPMARPETDSLEWVEADSEEQSELATAIGAAIEKHDM
jgi:hypothetical protein